MDDDQNSQITEVVKSIREKKSYSVGGESAVSDGTHKRLILLTLRNVRLPWSPGFSTIWLLFCISGKTLSKLVFVKKTLVSAKDFS